jgi:WD domain, G-beta repeat
MPMTCTCGKLLSVADHGGGQRVQCPQCGEFLQMLELAEEPPRPCPRRRPEKRSRLVWVVGLGGGAVVVAAVTACVMLVVTGSGPPHAATNSYPPVLPLNTMADSMLLNPDNLHNQKNVCQLAYSADGKLLATAAADATSSGLQQFIKVWDLASSRVVAQFPNDFSITSTLVFSPNGKRLAVGGGGRIEVWDLETKAVQHKDQLNTGSPMLGERLLAFSADGDLLVSVAQGVVWLMDLKTGQVVRDPVPLNRTAQVAHVPGQPQVAIAQLLDVNPPRGELTLYNYRTHRKTPMKDVAAWGTSIGYSGDGSTLAVATIDGPIRVFDTTTWNEKATLPRHRTSNNSFTYYDRLAVTADGRLVLGVAMGAGRPPCEAWIVGQSTTRLLAPGTCGPFVLSPDDTTIALVSVGEGVRFAAVAPDDQSKP